MQPFRALVVDDEAPARRLLRHLLDEAGGVEVAGEAASGAEALEAVRRLGPDVVFLDVQMPGMDGLEAAAELTRLEQPPRVVFVTAYDQYALRAFEVEAVDYLLKPVEPERLARTLERLGRPDAAPAEEDLMRVLRAVRGARGETLDRLALLDETSGVRHVVDLAEVVWISCEEEKTRVRLPSGFLRCMDTLGGLEARLPEDRFLRTHRSYLVNVDRVRRVEPWGSGAYNLELEGSDRAIPLSRHYAPRFKERVGWL